MGSYGIVSYRIVSYANRESRRESVGLIWIRFASIRFGSTQLNSVWLDEHVWRRVEVGWRRENEPLTLGINKQNWQKATSKPTIKRLEGWSYLNTYHCTLDFGAHVRETILQ